jgi:multiple sugar transport system permease protein
MTKKQKWKIPKNERNEMFWAWFLVAPTIIGLTILNIIPIFQTFYLSFFKSGAFGKGNIFIGLENYKTLIQDKQVWYSVRNTLMYTGLVVPITITVAMLIAVLLNKKIVGRNIYRSCSWVNWNRQD